MWTGLLTSWIDGRGRRRALRFERAHRISGCGAVAQWADVIDRLLKREGRLRVPSEIRGPRLTTTGAAGLVGRAARA